MSEFIHGNIRMILGDNREFLATLPDKAFSLAIDDPPYGIMDRVNLSWSKGEKSKTKFHLLYQDGQQWDKRPSPEYWAQLFRATANQVIFGANYFVDFLPVSRGWAFWDKMGDKMSSVNNELIFTSFDVSIKTFRRCHGLDKGFMNKEGGNIHPTQKPVALYMWLLQNYAKPGDTILDPHGGSFSSAIACHRMGFSYVGIEKDEDYFTAAVDRFRKEALQMKLFVVPQKPEPAPQLSLI